MQAAEKATARNYRDLIVWQDAIKLAKAVYGLLQKFPRQEMYALSDQIRRAVVSVPSNIAEGQARKAPAEFRHFLHIALGSLAEEFGYLVSEDVRAVNQQIQDRRMKLYALMNSLPGR
jgi:four helix bundle protein